MANYFHSLLRKSFAFLKKPRIFIPLTVLLILAFTPLSLYKERSSSQCSGCLTKRSEYQWFFGFAALWGIPVTPRWEVLNISRVYKDFAPVNHQHEWVFAQGSAYRLGYIQYSCGIGAGRNIGEFGQFYEKSQDFRKYIADQEKEKKMTHAQILTLLTLPSHPDESQTNTPAFREVSDTYRKMLDIYLGL